MRNEKSFIDGKEDEFPMLTMLEKAQVFCIPKMRDYKPEEGPPTLQLVDGCDECFGKHLYASQLRQLGKEFYMLAGKLTLLEDSL